jgi:hypothetical protein
MDAPPLSKALKPHQCFTYATDGAHVAGKDPSKCVGCLVAHKPSACREAVCSFP